MPGKSSAARSPALLPMKNRNVPLPSASRSSAATLTPQLSAKASAARVGAPRGVEGRRERRSLALQVLFGLARGEALHPHGEAPRRGVTGELTVRELRLVEPGGESRDQRLLQRQQRPGRQLLGADLQEEVVMLDLHAALTPEAASAARRSGKPSASRLS